MGAFIYKPLLYCYILLGAWPLVNTNSPLESGCGGLCGRGGVFNARIEHTPAPLPRGESHKATAFLSVSSIAAFHPVHVSTSNIEYNKTDNKVEVICTVFTDDFEAALAKQYHAKTDLNKADMHAAMDALVKNYAAANLNIKADNAPLKLNYLGFEINREATDIYLESDKIPMIKKVDVEVSLLYNLFDDQINIVHITVNGVRKSEKVDYPAKKVEQVF